MCKGCSVHFGNPKLFNAEAVGLRKMRQAAKDTNNLFDLLTVDNPFNLEKIDE